MTNSIGNNSINQTSGEQLIPSDSSINTLESLNVTSTSTIVDENLLQENLTNSSTLSAPVDNIASNESMATQNSTISDNSSLNEIISTVNNGPNNSSESITNSTVNNGSNNSSESINLGQNINGSSEVVAAINTSTVPLIQSLSNTSFDKFNKNFESSIS